MFYMLKVYGLIAISVFGLTGLILAAVLAVEKARSGFGSMR
jgi:hypothetical protein